MESIYSYTDYRKFLRDWYTEKKAVNPGFSYRIIASKVGFKSAGHFTLILQAKTNISLELAAKFAASIKLRSREAEYFTTLVLFNQAKTHAQQREYFSQLTRFRLSRAKIIDPSLYEYYSHWRHAVIRALLNIIDFRDDYQALATHIRPSVKPEDAKRSVELLVALGMIEKDGRGFWRAADRSVTTGYEAHSVAINNYLLSTLALAGRAIDTIPRDERNMSTLTLGVSRKEFEIIQEELREFRRRVSDIAARSEADRVYQLTIQLFPASHPVKEGHS